MARVSDAHLEARRQSILAAATKVFSQKGIAAATMAEIASEAGISPGAIYRYFENKEQLATGCMSDSSEAVQKAWVEPSKSELSFNELARLTFAGINNPEETVGTQLFLERVLIAVRDQDPLTLEDFAAEHQKVVPGIRYLMEAEYGRGLEGIDAEQLSSALYSFYWGARLLKLLIPESDPSAQLAQVQKILAAGIGKAASASSSTN